VLEARQRILGHEHPDRLNAMGNLALSYWYLGRTKEAAEMQVKVVDAIRRIRDDNHAHTLIAMGNLVGCYKELGRKEEAAQLEGVLNARKHEI
jgi:lipopolysaccharide biosynthesis regulator YciM